MLFKYEAREREGGEVSGQVEAADEAQAARALRGRNLLITSLVATGSTFDPMALIEKLRSVGLKEKVVFTRQLSTMISAGLPLANALEVLSRQTNDDKMRQTIEAIARDIDGGDPLSVAMSRHPKVFSAIYINLVKAGEASGVLDQVLKRLADTLESSRDFRSKLIGALIYPAIITIGMVAVFAIMMTTIIPKLTSMYEEMGADLPLPTKITMAISDFFVGYWWLLIIIIVGGVFGFVYLRRIENVRRWMDKVTFRLPIFGKLNQNSELVELTQTLALLLSSGISILDALEIVRGSVRSLIYKDVLATAKQQVSYGVPLAKPLKDSPFLPPVVSQMVAVGEETGKLDEVLTNLTKYFKSEAEAAIQGLTAAMEPLIMILLGLMVGGLIFSVIVPIYGLTSQF